MTELAEPTTSVQSQAAAPVLPKFDFIQVCQFQTLRKSDGTVDPGICHIDAEQKIVTPDGEIVVAKVRINGVSSTIAASLLKASGVKPDQDPRTIPYDQTSKGKQKGRKFRVVKYGLKVAPMASDEDELPYE